MLPICGKIYERILFISLYEYDVEENKLLSVHQSGFWSNDSCVNQLLLIVHNLYKAFDAYPTLKTCGVFLDMSFWQSLAPMANIQTQVTWGSRFSVKSDWKFLKQYRFQRVLLNGQTSEWLPVKAGVPQGSILGLLFFLIYINDLSDDLVSTIKLFADDTSLFSVVHDQWHIQAVLEPGIPVWVPEL